jgi:hypothetical protein
MREAFDKEELTKDGFVEQFTALKEEVMGEF